MVEANAAQAGFGTGTDEETIVAKTEHILFKRSKIHGTGGFARVDIPAGTRLIEYVGEKISKEESLRRCEANNEYIFTLDEEFDLDGNVSYNPARFINHSCAPNCEAVGEENEVWIDAARDIRAGEELTFNYGYDLEDYKEHPCRCGAMSCVGYIVAEEYFSQLAEQQRLVGGATTLENPA